MDEKKSTVSASSSSSIPLKVSLSAQFKAHREQQKKLREENGATE
jgi:hypothetical protein